WSYGVKVLPKHFAPIMYPGMRNYLIVGLYRNGRIGDPNLLYPDGTHVYGPDGTPGVAYLDGFIVGKTQQSILAERPWGPPAPDASTDAGPSLAPGPQAPDVDGGTAPVKAGLAGIGYPSGCT